MTLTWEFLVGTVGTIAGAAGMITYWGGRIARSNELVVEGLKDLTIELRAQSAKISDHGEKIAALQARQEAQR